MEQAQPNEFCDVCQEWADAYGRCGCHYKRFGRSRIRRGR